MEARLCTLHWDIATTSESLNSDSKIDREMSRRAHVDCEVVASEDHVHASRQYRCIAKKVAANWCRKWCIALTTWVTLISKSTIWTVCAKFLMPVCGCRGGVKNQRYIMALSMDGCSLCRVRWLIKYVSFWHSFFRSNMKAKMSQDPNARTNCLEHYGKNFFRTCHENTNYNSGHGSEIKYSICW